MDGARASDAEREAVADRLQRAAAEGRLTAEELDERLGVAYAARTRAELEPLTADLPSPAPARGDTPAGPVVDRRGGGRRWIVNVLGGGTQRGRWRAGRRMTVVSILGGGDVDLTEAIFEDDVLDLVFVDVLGGSDLTVPEGVRVESGGFVLLGGGDVELEGPRPSPDAPLVRVRRFGLLGGGDVRTSGARGRRRHGRPGHRPPRLP